MVSKINWHPPAGCRQIKASFVLVTPAYLRGATGNAELRAASFKGVLRFWWRALRWATVRAASADDSSALTELQRQEAELFGAAASDVVSQSGQGSIKNFRIQPVSPKTLVKRDAGTPISSAEAYFLGMGLADAREKKTKAEALQAGAQIEMTLLIHDSSSSNGVTSGLLDAILLMGTVGGVGSRTRRGQGSLAIQTLFVDDVAQAVPDSAKTLHELLQKFKAPSKQLCGLPPFTAFCANTVWRIREGCVDVLHEQISAAMIRFRSYGFKKNGLTDRKNTMGEVVSHPNFPGDHDSISDAVHQGITPVSAPLRSAFGLPHNYIFSTKKTADIDAFLVVDPGTSAKNIATRRASPLMIHFHQFPGNAGTQAPCAAIMIYWPAVFLPKGAKISVKTDRDVFLLPAPVLDATKGVIPDFMARSAKLASGTL